MRRLSAFLRILFELDDQAYTAALLFVLEWASKVIDMYN